MEWVENHAFSCVAVAWLVIVGTITILVAGDRRAVALDWMRDYEPVVHVILGVTALLLTLWGILRARRIQREARG